MINFIYLLISLNKKNKIWYNLVMQIIRSYRKTLSITIDEKGELLVKAPLLLSMKKINEFIQSKEEWIKKQQKKIKLKEKNISQYDFKNFVYLSGKPIYWNDVKAKDKRITKASFYTKLFYDIVLKNAENIAKNNHFNVNFKLCNSKTIWGSCNSKRIIKLNWKLILLPENLQKYIIIHELSHLKEMNHSKKFWIEVEKLDPDYKTNRNELNLFSSLLRVDVLTN